MTLGSFSERKYTFKNGMGETIARVGRNFFEVGIPKRHASTFFLSRFKWIQIHSVGLIIILIKLHAILLTKAISAEPRS